MNSPTIYEIAKFENEEGFKNGWYVIQLPSSRSCVIWQSDAFETEAEAITEMEAQISQTN